MKQFVSSVLLLSSIAGKKRNSSKFFQFFNLTLTRSEPTGQIIVTYIVVDLRAQAFVWRWCWFHAMSAFLTLKDIATPAFCQARQLARLDDKYFRCFLKKVFFKFCHVKSITFLKSETAILKILFK